MASGTGIHKKLGPLEVWQYVAIGTSAGFMYYLYEKKRTEGEETAAGEKEGEYIGGNPLGGGGSSSSPGYSPPPTAAEIAALVPAGPAGAPGAPGPAGEAGAAGAPSTTPETPGNTLNNPPTGRSTPAPQAKVKPATTGTNAKGEKYTISRVTKNGVKYIVHTYHNGRKEFMKVVGKGKGSKAGDTHKPSRARKPPLKAPKHKAAAKPKPKAKHRGR